MFGFKGMSLSIAFLTCTFATSIQAAQINTTSANGTQFVTIDGIIREGDDRTFTGLTSALPAGSVVLFSSQGGSVVQALEIGRTIRMKSFKTAVASDDLCASACALMWLAGATRFMGATSHIGFHAAYNMVNGKSAGESGVGNALVGAYLSQLGLQQDTIVWVTSAPPEGMAWLTPQTSDQVGIDVSALENTPQQAVPSPKPGVYDPLKAVTAFYSALGAADGETAAALVVPDKRGKGPFNEANIHQFFGGLSQPLQLRGTVLETKDNVEATYQYAKADGSACHGKSLVRTTFAYGTTLIAGIRALSGC
jgi:hypothetical protein